jgi:heptosyltransferase-2
VTSILILKTAALGDVLRTTSILPGLHARYRDCRVTWVTARGAADLVRTHPLVGAVETVDVADPASVAALTKKLAATRWTRVISLDDERPLCELASALDAEKISGAYLREDGQRAYTDDVAPWFDMGLLSTFGKAEADRLKIANTKSHPAIYAEMLGLPMGKPGLHLPESSRAFGRAFADRHRLHDGGAVVGLNTGAGGRWVSKQLSIERTIELAEALHAKLDGRATFVVMGGGPEAERNRAILDGLARSSSRVRSVDAGCDNALLDFAALVTECDLLVTSDSLALHMAIAEDVRVVAFFAPTSAAEIELYGLGEKIPSTASDYCSYKPDADNSTITVPRLCEAALRELALPRTRSRRA